MRPIARPRRATPVASPDVGAGAGLGAGVSDSTDTGGTGQPPDCAHHEGASGWVLLPPGHVPQRWRRRAQQVMLVPLLPDELPAVLAGTPTSPQLDERDEQLARLVAAGASIRQMAGAVDMSPRGVQHRLARLRERFGVETTAELVAQLVRHGLVVASTGNTTPQESPNP